MYRGVRDDGETMTAAAGLNGAAQVVAVANRLPGQQGRDGWQLSPGGLGTALRPVYARLSAEEAAEFDAELGSMLREAYPPQPYGTVLPFRRIFAVAQVPA